MTTAAIAPWILYGAYGFTGRLMAREAVTRGLSPILAGRDEGKVEELAGELGLAARVFGLDDPDELRRGIRERRPVLPYRIDEVLGRDDLDLRPGETPPETSRSFERQY